MGIITYLNALSTVFPLVFVKCENHGYNTRRVTSNLTSADLIDYKSSFDIVFVYINRTWFKLGGDFLFHTAPSSDVCNYSLDEQ